MEWRIGRLASCLLVIATGSSVVWAAVASQADWLPSRFSSVRVVDRLSHDRTYSLALDPDGYLWIATQNGLDRYDGGGVFITNFAHDRNDPSSIAEDDVSNLLISRDGTLWVGTWGAGLDRFDKAAQSFIHELPAGPGGLFDGRIQALFEDRSGALWIGTFGGGLARYRPESGDLQIQRATQGDEDAINHDRVWAIVEDAEEGLWIGSSAGLERIAEDATGKIRSIEGIDLGDGVSARVLLLDEDRLLIGCRQGLLVLDLASRQVRAAVDEGVGATLLSSVSINALHHDSFGRLWVGTDGHGLFLVEGSAVVRHYRHDRRDSASISHDDVRWLLEDRFTNLWIATRGGGLSRLSLRPPRFGLVEADPESVSRLPAAAVESIYVDGAGATWIGSQAGLYRRSPDEESFTEIIESEAVGAGIRSIWEDGSGDLWLGSWFNGLMRWRAEDGKIVSFVNDPEDASSLSNNEVNWVTGAAHGNVWVATQGGINLLDAATGESTRFVHEASNPGSLADDLVWQVIVDRDGKLWAATDRGGVNVMDEFGEFRHFRFEAGNPSSLSSDRVSVLREAADGRIWVGTDDGLNSFDGEGFRRYGRAEGLPDHSIHGILDDQNGQIWISTDRGLASLDPATGEIRAHTLYDGLQSWIFIPRSLFAGPSGQLYFGGVNGYNVVGAERRRQRGEVPTVLLTRFKVDGEVRDFGRELKEVETIELSPDLSQFSFDFASLDLTNPVTNAYRYRLEGFDQQWIEAGNRAWVSYTNIDPGSYRFRVQAAGSEGVWNRQGAEVEIIVHPPIWGTRWFRSSALAMLVLGLVAVHRMRMRSLAQRARRLEEIVAERSQVIARRRDQLETINSIATSINSELKFDDLLATILDDMRVLKRMDAAVALVWDRRAKVYRCRAAAGIWDKPETFELSADRKEIENDWVVDAQVIAPNIFLARSRQGEYMNERLRGFQAAHTVLGIRIVFEEQVVGYFIFGTMEVGGGFDPEDIVLIESLYQQIVSTFLRTKMLSELKDLNEQKNEFLGMAAHDLRSPLGLISAWTRITIKAIEGGSFEPDKAVDKLGRVADIAERMTRMVSELLDYAAIEAGSITLDRREHHLGPIIRSCHELYVGLAEQKGIDLAIELPAGLPPVLADSERIAEVLDNLVSNAIKYTHAGGAVQISCAAEQGTVVTRISDNGQGLTDEDLQAVFGSFKKLSARPTAGESSSGLGLAIAKKIVEEHEGEIWVESVKDEGSTFAFSLPWAEDDPQSR